VHVLSLQPSQCVTPKLVILFTFVISTHLFYHFVFSSLLTTSRQKHHRLLKTYYNLPKYTQSQEESKYTLTLSSHSAKMYMTTKKKYRHGRGAHYSGQYRQNYLHYKSNQGQHGLPPNLQGSTRVVVTVDGGRAGGDYIESSLGDDTRLSPVPRNRDMPFKKAGEWYCPLEFSRFVQVVGVVIASLSVYSTLYVATSQRGGEYPAQIFLYVSVWMTVFTTLYFPLSLISGRFEKPTREAGETTTAQTATNPQSSSCLNTWLESTSVVLVLNWVVVVLVYWPFIFPHMEFLNATELTGSVGAHGVLPLLMIVDLLLLGPVVLRNSMILWAAVPGVLYFVFAGIYQGTTQKKLYPFLDYTSWEAYVVLGGMGLYYFLAVLLLRWILACANKPQTTGVTKVVSLYTSTLLWWTTTPTSSTMNETTGTTHTPLIHTPSVLTHNAPPLSYLHRGGKYLGYVSSALAMTYKRSGLVVADSRHTQK
jgi:hypothetical protein